MPKMRNLLLAAITVLFTGVSVVPVAAATPDYASKYSWSGYKYNYSNNNAHYSNYRTPSYNKTSNTNYNSYANSYYGYTPAPRTTPVAKPAAALSTSLQEQQMVNLVNQERTSRGLKALAVDATLVKVARMKSQDMINKNYFGHQSPTYGSPFDLMKAQGVTYRYAGENLAGANTVQQAHTNLMNSAGHRANILNQNYTKIGVGVVQGGPYGLMISEEFTG